MKKNSLFASMASKAFVLAAAMMMSVAFTACSSDDDDVVPPVANTVTINDRVMPVVSAEYRTFGSSQEVFNLFLNIDGENYVLLGGSTALHIGRDINLTTKEPAGKKDYWIVGFFDADSDDWLFQTNGNPTLANPAFTSGTLRMDGNPIGGEVTVSLKNGKITDAVNGDGKERTISINWKGTAKKL